MITAFTNCRIYDSIRVKTDTAILVENSKVISICPDNLIPEDCLVEDLNGDNISAAFIDLQIYGGNGKLFSHDLSVEAIEATYQYCLAGGAAHFMLTMATNSIDKFITGMEIANQYLRSGGKGLLGIHLEGPYLNPVKKGAHIEHYIHSPTLDEVQQLVERGEGILKMITIAPEQCDEEIIKFLLDKKILVSAGHSNASYAEAMSAFNSGIPAATHLFNAMSAFQSREPGMVGAIFDNQQVKSSVVCDGIHVDFAAIRISKKILQERMFYITDAVTEIREGDYQHIFQGDRYTLPNGVLSGSSLTMMQCVKNGVQKVGIELDESLRMGSMYPARLLGDDFPKGSIKEGADANFVIFNNDLEVIRVVTTA